MQSFSINANKVNEMFLILSQDFFPHFLFLFGGDFQLEYGEIILYSL